MDQLANYDDNSSDSCVDTPDSPRIKRVTTGTIEKVTDLPIDFDKLERSFPLTTVASTCTPSSTRNAAAPSSPPSPSRSRTKRHRANSPPPKPQEPSTTFHLDETHDYQNRAWNLPAPHLRSFSQLETYRSRACRRVVCAFPGAHRRGATVVQFSPTYGALLLSAGLDGSAHVRVTETGDIARSYSHGHDGGIRDARFDAAGGRFATGGFDGRVVVRDVETGDVTYRRKLGGVVYCVRWGGNEGGFIAGCGDRQVVQVDLRVKDGGVVQRYGEHMGSVLSLCFIDQGRRFVTSAEDKVLRVWEFGVPVVIKYVSEAGMHCIPMLKMHPNGKWVAGISADNCVRVFSCRDRFKKWDGKRFGGGIWGGYSGGLGFAPDGRLLGAGDSLGRLLIWDWRNCSNVAAIQAHDGVVMGFDWHPTSPSLIASCGWDGAVKMWH